MSAAFVHMYNAMSHPTYPSKENLISFSKDVSRAYRALSMMVRSNGFGARGLSSLSYSQAYDRVLRIEELNYKAGVVLGTAAEFIVTKNIPSFVVSNAYSFYSGANFETIPISPSGAAGYVYGEYIREDK